MSFYINSKSRTKRIFAGVVLLAVAAALICYSAGLGPILSGIPLYKIILGLVLISWIIKKIFFSRQLRKRFQIAIPLALLFMLFEKEIATFAGLPDENIVNNWIVAAAAIIYSIAICLIIPRYARFPKNGFSIKFTNTVNGTNVGSSRAFSSEMLYIDAAASPNAAVTNYLGSREVFYQNTDAVPEGSTVTLDINNSLGTVEVHIPDGWKVTNNIETSIANTEIRQNRGNRVNFIVTGVNNIGTVEIMP